MKRVFYPYPLWEEWKDGMWRFVRGEYRKELKDRARNLMLNTTGFYDAMKKALSMWPISAEMNLSAKCMNRRAWLGHAGCCVATSSPEDITREAWHTLSKEKQDAADAVAEKAIAEWENSYAKAKTRR